MIKVSVYGALSQLTRSNQFTAEASSIKQLIEQLTQRFGKDFKQAVKAAKIFHNGANVAFHQGVKTALQSGDEVVFLSPVAGG